MRDEVRFVVLYVPRNICQVADELTAGLTGLARV